MKPVLVVLAFLSMIFMLTAQDVIPGVTKGTGGNPPLNNKPSVPCPYYPAIRQNEVLFVEDPGNVVFGPSLKPDPNWLGLMDNIVGTGDYGWFGPTTDTADDGPSLDTMQQYPIVIWNCYDNWWDNLTSNDTVNIAAYIEGGGKVWLIGQDIIYSGMLDSWLATYFHLQSYVQDYSWEDESLRIVGQAEIAGSSFTVSTDYQGNGFFCDHLVPDANAHYMIFDSTYLEYNSIAYPNVTPLQTSFWTIDGRGPSSPSDWQSMVQTMLEAFGWTGISEEQEDVRPITFGFTAEIPTLIREPVRIAYMLPHRGPISITLYDNAGRIVYILTNGYAEQGSGTITYDPTGLAKGVYFLRLESQAITDQHKLVILE